MKVSAILCMTYDGVIGNTNTNTMPWHSVDDLKHFRDKTMGKPCLFGANTYFNLPRRPLDGRLNVVISANRGKKTNPNDEYIVYPNVEQALADIDQQQSPEVMICGGGQLYQYCIKNGLIDKIYLTTISNPKWDSKTFAGPEFVRLDTETMKNLKSDQWVADIASLKIKSDLAGNMLIFQEFNKKSR